MKLLVLSLVALFLLNGCINMDNRARMIYYAETKLDCGNASIISNCSLAECIFTCSKNNRIVKCEATEGFPCVNLDTETQQCKSK